MSKKHFEALAAALQQSQPVMSAPQRKQWERDVQSVAEVCARFNPNFDRERFLKACGVEG